MATPAESFPAGVAAFLLLFTLHCGGGNRAACPTEAGEAGGSLLRFSAGRPVALSGIPKGSAAAGLSFTRFVQLAGRLALNQLIEVRILGRVPLGTIRHISEAGIMWNHT